MNESISLHLSPFLDRIEDSSNDITSTLGVQCSSVKYAIMKAKQKLLFMVISPFSTTPASHINQSGKRTNVISTTLPSLALLYFQSHMIEKHSFVSDTDACFNCESTGQLGYYIPVPDQLIYIFCKQCEIFQDLDTYS